LYSDGLPFHFPMTFCILMDSRDNFDECMLRGS
jgi:hypothetical protein